MSIFFVKNINGMNRLFLKNGPYYRGDIIYTLSGPVLDNPTQTSIKISDYNHIEDDWGKYINHSCFPNIKIRNCELIALKDLDKGTEITFNYLENEDELVVPFYCECCGRLIA